jgi:hypothetical protein
VSSVLPTGNARGTTPNHSLNRTGALGSLSGNPRGRHARGCPTSLKHHKYEYEIALAEARWLDGSGSKSNFTPWSKTSPTMRLLTMRPNRSVNADAHRRAFGPPAIAGYLVSLGLATHHFAIRCAWRRRSHRKDRRIFHGCPTGFVANIPTACF